MKKIILLRTRGGGTFFTYDYLFFYLDYQIFFFSSPLAKTKNYMKDFSFLYDRSFGFN